MIFIRPISIDFINQFSIITVMIALINLGISFISNINEKIKEIETELAIDKKGHFRPPEYLEKIMKFDHKKYANKLFHSFIIIVVVYFVLILFSNINPDFLNVESIFFSPYSIYILLKNSTCILYTNTFNTICITIGTFLTWFQLMMIIRIYIQIIIIIKKYKDLLIESKSEK